MDREDSDLEVYGLSSESRRFSRAELMARAHRHNEIELYLVEAGSVAMLIGQQRQTLTARQIVVFWGAIPHQSIDMEDPLVVTYLTLPLAQFLNWGLPDAIVQQVLQGQPIIDRSSAASKEGPGYFHQWHEDLTANTVERRAIGMLELEAYFRRLALDIGAEPPSTASTATPHEGWTPAEQMAQFMVTNYMYPIRVDDIASVAGLHPKYAAHRFRSAYGVSLIEYLTQYRVAQAQRLLAVTDASVMDVALESGFESLSWFYEAFNRLCGQTPGRYRRTFRRLAARRSG